MDLADDIAYSCFDIVDGVQARFLTPEKVADWRDEKGDSLGPVPKKHLTELLEMMPKGGLSRKMNAVIGELIQSSSLAPTENFMTAKTRRYAYKLIRQPEAQQRIQLHKNLAGDLIFGSSALRQIEFKGGLILKKMAEIYFDNYLEAPKPAILVPDDVHRAVKAAPEKTDKARLLCDHLSGMTDAYALRSYKRLLDPDYGSISELI